MSKKTGAETFKMGPKGPEKKPSGKRYVAEMIGLFKEGSLLEVLNQRPLPITPEKLALVEQALAHLSEANPEPAVQLEIILCKKGLDSARRNHAPVPPYTAEEKNFGEQILDLKPEHLFKLLNARPNTLQGEYGHMGIIEDIVSWRLMTGQKQDRAYTLASTAALDHLKNDQPPVPDPQEVSRMVMMAGRDQSQMSGFKDLGALIENDIPEPDLDLNGTQDSGEKIHELEDLGAEELEDTNPGVPPDLIDQGPKDDTERDGDEKETDEEVAQRQSGFADALTQEAKKIKDFNDRFDPKKTT